MTAAVLAAGELLGEGGLAAFEVSNPVGWAILGGTALYLGWKWYQNANEKADEQGAQTPPGSTCNCPTNGEKSEEPVDVYIDHNKYPDSAGHVRDAQADGHPSEITVDRGDAADSRRRAAISGTPTVPGQDRDEYPPAVSKEGGSGASVRPVPFGDNRGAGASMGAQIRGLPNGTRIRIIPIAKP